MSCSQFPSPEKSSRWCVPCDWVVVGSLTSNVLAIPRSVCDQGGSLRVQIDFRPKFFECKEEAGMQQGLENETSQYEFSTVTTCLRRGLRCSHRKKRMRCTCFFALLTAHVHHPSSQRTHFASCTASRLEPKRPGWCICCHMKKRVALCHWQDEKREALMFQVLASAFWKIWNLGCPFLTPKLWCCRVCCSTYR